MLLKKLTSIIEFNCIYLLKDLSKIICALLFSYWCIRCIVHPLGYASRNDRTPCIMSSISKQNILQTIKNNLINKNLNLYLRFTFNMLFKNFIYSIYKCLTCNQTSQFCKKLIPSTNKQELKLQQLREEIIWNCIVFKFSLSNGNCKSWVLEVIKDHS